jgi:hypothetical protein
MRNMSRDLSHTIRRSVERPDAAPPWLVTHDGHAADPGRLVWQATGLPLPGGLLREALTTYRHAQPTPRHIARC